MRYEPGLVAVALFTPPALYGSPQLHQDLPQTSSISGFLSQPRDLSECLDQPPCAGKCIVVLALLFQILIQMW